MRLFSRLTKLVLGSFAALAILAAILTTALLFLDLGFIRAQLESRAAEAFGRQVTFQGSIRLEPSLRPIFMAEDFRIGNPDWASRPDLAQVERLEVRVALLPLFRGELEVLDITFRGADVLLEVGPDGINNFTFGRREGPPALPDIDTFSVQDSVIGYQMAGGALHRCAVIQARAKNMPEQPVELEGQVACRDVPMRFSLSGGTPEQFAAPKPWPLAVTMSTGDASLVVEGSLPAPGKWDGTEFQVSIQGEKVDSLNALFDVDLPVHGPFEFSAGLSKSKGAYSISDLEGRIGSSDIAGQLQWKQAGGRPFVKGKIASQAIHIQELMATPDPNSADNAKPELLDRPIPFDWIAVIDAELELDVKQVPGSPVAIDNAAVTAKLDNGQLAVSALQVTLEGIPLSGDLAITPGQDAPAIRLAVQTKRLDPGKLLERLEASVPVRGNAENLTLTVNGRGRTLRTLFQRADLSLKAQGGNITFGDAGAEKPWTLEIAAAEIEAKQDQPLRITMDGTYRAVPFSLALDTVTPQALAAATRPWPLVLSVSTEDASLDAKGNVPELGTWDGAEFQVSIRGEKVDSLNALFDVDLPVHGPFEFSAGLSKSEDAYSVSVLEGSIGSTDIAGELHWKQAGGRPVLKGKIASQSMRLQDFFAEAGSNSASKKDFLDRPIPLDWIAAIDAELELDIKRFSGTSAPIRDAAATAKLDNGQLTLSALQATLAGTPITGNFTIAPGADMPSIRFAAQSQRLDLGDLLQRLQASAKVRGNAEGLTLTVNTRGHTVRTLLQSAEFGLKAQRGRITFAGAQADQPLTLDIAAAAVEAKAAGPISISVDGAYRGIPLALAVDAMTLETLATAGTGPWPLDVSLQTSPASLKASGSVRHPFQGRGFDLAFEITGEDLRKVDPLIGFVIPLKGEYRLTGRFTDDADRYRLSDIQVKVGQSDIGGSIVIVTEKPRPGIIANLTSQTFHIDDLKVAGGANKHETRVIPEYIIPAETLRSVNLDVDLKAEQVHMRRNTLGDLMVTATIENGALDLSVQVTDDWTGARLSFKHQLDVTTNPPVNSLELTARDLDYGLILTQAEVAGSAEGRVDVEIELAGPGASLRSFLGRADGRITVIGGPGRIASRELELWASGLMRMMLSTGWRGEATTELNCIVGHIDVEDGVASTDKLLLDTGQLTIAGSGTLNLDTERLDLLLSPNPKQANLVNFANPVRVTGTLAAPTVTVTKLPRPGTAAASGLLAGLVNPAFLLFAFTDIGSGSGNPCVAAIEQRDSAPHDERRRGGILQRFRGLF